MKLSRLLPRLLPGAAALALLASAAPIAGAGCNTGSYCNASTQAALSTLSRAVPQTTYSGFHAVGANIAVADHPASHYAYTPYTGSSYSGSSYSGSGNAQIFNASTGTFSASTPSSSVRPSGLASDEYLCPASCPVDVSAPAGARVIDCFQICKKTPTYTPTYTVKTQAYQVVRPVIYMRYPVPVPVATPAPACPIIEFDAPSRYGSRYNSCGF